ncbi:MAG: thioredoxin-disulfide reductase [Clostridiales bacterium]|nr:MAG: thioredoxin-disulfide reductase [Clostridiales bacterium]
MKDIVIIGAGPAGLTAAIYALRAGKSVLVLEKELFGGQITYSPSVENYPGYKQISGNEFAENLIEQATALGAEIELAEATKIVDGPVKTVITDGGSYECKSVIIAAGSRHRRLGLRGEEELIGAGVSYCAVCDGAFFKGKTVAVAGGGDAALQDAIFLSDRCRKVFVIHRRDTFRGEARLETVLRSRDNVEFVMNSVVESLEGKEKLSGVTVRNRQTGETKTIPLDGLFIAVGQEPQNTPFSDMIALDGAGYADAGEDCRTGTPGIFVAGDCRRKAVRQLTTAVGDGAVAGLAAVDYINSL